MNNIKRLFFANPIESNVISKYIIPELKESLKNENISWAKNHQLHLTLKFLGDTPIHNIKLLNHLFENLTQNYLSYNIKIKNIKIFGSRYKPQVIWIGIEDNGQTNDLYQTIQKEFHLLGVKKKSQNFVPHITLGRIKKISDKTYFQEVIHKYSNVEAETIKIEKFVLFESQLTTKGAIHIPLNTFLLKQNY
jgi:2'-5' RNA ligase